MFAEMRLIRSCKCLAEIGTPLLRAQVLARRRAYDTDPQTEFMSMDQICHAGALALFYLGDSLGDYLGDRVDWPLTRRLARSRDERATADHPQGVARASLEPPHSVLGGGA